MTASCHKCGQKRGLPVVFDWFSVLRVDNMGSQLCSVLDYRDRQLAEEGSRREDVLAKKKRHSS